LSLPLVCDCHPYRALDMMAGLKERATVAAQRKQTRLALEARTGKEITRNIHPDAQL
jgi:hypothetical protein